MKESELKQLVIGYLHIKQNQGELMWLRLNAGMLQIGSHMITLTPPGTADLLVIQRGKPIFIELKGEKGTLSVAQQDFGKLAEKNGADYVVIRDFEELLKIC